jgi:hypothetical protein
VYVQLVYEAHSTNSNNNVQFSGPTTFLHPDCGEQRVLGREEHH